MPVLPKCLFHSVATWSSPETTGPRPLPNAGFSFTKVDLSRAVMFGGRQRHQRVNEVHILDMDNWVFKLGCMLVVLFLCSICNFLSCFWVSMHVNAAIYAGYFWIIFLNRVFLGSYR